MEVANQNLGILLYEDLVNHYSEVHPPTTHHHMQRCAGLI
jgi:hypothetical protein